MALTDIVFYESDMQSSILEIPQGSLGTPNDIMAEYLMYYLLLSSGSAYFAYIG